MDADHLVGHGLGYVSGEDLAVAPALSRLQVLSERTGVHVNRLLSMTISGLSPWLLDSLDFKPSDAQKTYALQFSVLSATRLQRWTKERGRP